MDTKALRQKILDLAIRGKLVPQDPNDEPASVLLERIRAKKQQMVKEGKLKAKDIKNDTVIFVGEDNLHYEKFQDGSVKCIEDEIPFEIPQGWEWCRLINIIQLTSGQDLSVAQYNGKGDGIPYITGASNFVDGKIKIERWTTSPKTITTVGDLLITCKGTVGELAFNDFGRAHIARQIMAIRKFEGIDNGYLGIAIQAFVSNLIKQANGIIPGISRDVILNILFPLPPINEQIKIFKTTNYLLATISDIENQEVDLQILIKSAKFRILDLAIQGKLVPQDPNDEPASVLLERIRQEKEELIKQGKIKRDKKESVIFKGEDNSYYEKIGEKVTCIDDMIPFEIPSGWAWIRLGSILNIERGGSPRPIKSYITNNDYGVSWIKIGDVEKDGKYIEVTKEKIIPEGVAKSREVYPGDFLLTNSMSFGRPYIAKIYGCIHDGWLVLRNSNQLFSIDFLYYLLSSGYVYNQFAMKASGSTVDNLNIDKVASAIIPLPAMTEQNRISVAIDNITNILKRIEASLS